uniref:CCR4-NOT transcription complex subunit 11 n=1 Tax=Ascaris lumbricoides TaxID=6252 RepID=A0A0M3IH15_ASCLU
MCVSQLVGILNESFFNDCPLLEAVRCSQSTKQKKAQQMICAYLLFDRMLLEMVCALCNSLPSVELEAINKTTDEGKSSLKQLLNDVVSANLLPEYTTFFIEAVVDFTINKPALPINQMGKLLGVFSLDVRLRSRSASYVRFNDLSGDHLRKMQQFSPTFVNRCNLSDSLNQLMNAC